MIETYKSEIMRKWLKYEPILKTQT